ASWKTGADEIRSAPDAGGLRPGRAGSVGLSHEGSAHAAPPRPIGPPARSTAPSLLPRAGAPCRAEGASVNRRSPPSVGFCPAATASPDPTMDTQTARCPQGLGEIGLHEFLGWAFRAYATQGPRSRRTAIVVDDLPGPGDRDALALIDGQGVVG